MPGYKQKLLNIRELKIEQSDELNHLNKITFMCDTYDKFTQTTKTMEVEIPMCSIDGEFVYERMCSIEEATFNFKAKCSMPVCANSFYHVEEVNDIKSEGTSENIPKHSHEKDIIDLKEMTNKAADMVADKISEGLKGLKSTEIGE